MELIKFDKKLAKAHSIIGVDEAGRGPLAGSVVACALHFPEFNKELNEAIKYLDDSKKFSSNPKLRQELAEEIKQYAKYSIKECSVREIEKYNILQASLLAMKRACEDLLKQINPDKEPILLIDGKFAIPGYKIAQTPIVKGDGKSASIAAASILAKVYRDEMMCKLAQEYPEYRWHQNKGYPTQAHIAAILEHGPCTCHRKTFLKKVLIEEEQLSLL